MTTPPRPDADPVLSKILGETGDAPELPPKVAHRVEHVDEPPTVVPDSSGDAPSILRRFLGDADTVELFLLEMCARADSAGAFPTAEGIEVLREQFGFPNNPWSEDKYGYSHAYQALALLAKKGHLEKLTAGYRIPHDTFERLRAPKPAKTLELVPAEATPGIVFEGMTAEKARSVSMYIEALDMLVVCLNSNREALERKRAEQSELQKRLQTLGEEIASLVAAVEDPGALEAEQIAAGVKARLAGWG